MKKNGIEIAIGELSNQTGISVETIRYYELKGLLLPAGRKISGYRIYNEESLKTLSFLKRAQSLGFSLSEIKELLKLRASGGPCCNDVKGRASKHLQNIEGKIKKLEAIHIELSQLLEQCHSNQEIDRCPILDTFDKVN